jgi:small subunit ribosomal protein S8
MTVASSLVGSFTTIMENELRGNRECTITPASKLVASVLRVMQKQGYIGEIELVDDGRGGKINVQLLGRINKCASINPHFPVTQDETEDWIRSYLPSRDLGIVILSTSAGVLTHHEAREKKIGGSLLAYVY